MKEHEEYNLMINSLITFITERDLKFDSNNPILLYNTWINQKGYVVQYPNNAMRLCSFIQSSLGNSLNFAQYLN